MFRTMRAVVFAAVMALAMSCGGGSDADTGQPAPDDPPESPPANPPAPAVPSLVVSPAAINVQAPITQDAVSLATLHLAFRDIADSDVIHFGATYSRRGISGIALSSSGPGALATLTFWKSSEMPVGNYQDTVTLRACRETPCVNHLAGSPVAVAVNYTVTAPGPPSMTLSTSSIAFDRFLLESSGPSAAIDVRFPNSRPGDTPSIFIASEGSAVASTTYSRVDAASGAAGRVSVLLKPPYSVGVGTASDTVTVRACADAVCASEFTGSPASFTVKYTISDVLSGDRFRQQFIPVIANDLVWNPARNVFYLSIPSSSPTNPDSIAAFDPVSATFTAFVPVGRDPGQLELSPDGQYLFVALRGAGEIKRLTLPSLTHDLTIPLGKRAGTDLQLYSTEFHVSPDSPHVLGVIRGRGSAPGIAIFDDATMRPEVASGPGGQGLNTFQWHSGSRLFAVDSATSSRIAAQIAVGPSGLEVTASQPVEFPMALHGGDARLMSGRMYTASGVVYDPETFTSLGRIPVTFGSGTAFALDPEQRKVFFATPWEIVAYNADTFALLESIPATNFAPLVPVSRMARWGHDGLALLNHDASRAQRLPGLILIKGAFVRP